MLGFWLHSAVWGCINSAADITSLLGLALKRLSWIIKIERQHEKSDRDICTGFCGERGGFWVDALP
jgi:hypothetical protein